MDPRKPVNTPSWPCERATRVANLTGHLGGVAAVAFSRDRGLLASVGRSGPGRLWDLGGTPRERGVFGKSEDRFQSLAFSPDNRLVAAGSASLDGVIRLFDVSDKAPRELGALAGARGAIDALAFSPDGRTVAGAGEDRIVRIWDPGAGTRIDARIQLTGHSGPVKALAYAPDGHNLVTAGRESTVRLWTISAIRAGERGTLPHPGEVTAVAWSPDGRTVATACQDGVVRLWDPTATKPMPRAEMEQYPAVVRRLLITPDSRVLVGIAESGKVMNWDMPSGLPVREWDVTGSPFAAAALTQDGRYLALGSQAGRVDVYRVGEKRT